MRVIVTRPASEATAWVQALAQRGLDAVALPLITIAPVADADAVRAAWAEVGRYAALMFVSAPAVAHFFAHRPTDVPGGQALPPIWVPGPGTAAALVREGVDPAHITLPAAGSPQWDSEALWARIAPGLQPGGRVLIVRGDQQRDETDAAPAMAQGVGREWLATQLVRAGMQVDYVATYRRMAPVLAPAQAALARAAAQDGSVWLFSSAQAVANLCAALPAQAWSGARAVATHPRIAEAAQGAGFGVVWRSRPAMAEVAASIESIR